MKRQPICYVFGAGEHHQPPPAFEPDGFIIAADGGLAHLERHGVAPDLWVGDGDSLAAPPDAAEALLLPCEKDDTDMAAALREGWQRGYRAFHIYGGTGGRLDHTLANIQLLADLARRGGRGYLFDENTVITAIHNGSVSFPASARGTVSVFAHSDAATGVCERGLKYPLDGATLSNARPLGISNEFVGKPGAISVANGTLIVVHPQSVREEGHPIPAFQ